MSLYLCLLLGSLAIPLGYSILVRNYIEQKSFLISTSLIALFFLVWDAAFTHLGIWEFNSTYCSGLRMLGMPLEEWMFFFIIPFCSLFIHFVLVETLPNLKLNKKVTRLISLVAIAITTVVLVSNASKAYTAVNATFLLLVLVLGVLYYLETLRHFFLSFLIILIPFFIINGVLTGSLIDAPVVSYSSSEIIGIRLLTIPVEDTGYAFTMLFGNLMIYELLRRKFQSKALCTPITTE